MASKCKACSITRADNGCFCVCCGKKWEADRENDIHTVSELRDGDFGNAAEIFEDNTITRSAALALTDIAEGCVQQAENIDRILVEELEKVSKEPAYVETDISEKESIRLIRTLLEAQLWQEAAKYIDAVLLHNPCCAEAIWYKLLAEYQVSANDALVKKMYCFRSSDFNSIKSLLRCASKEFAEEILSLLYDAEDKVSGATYKKILDTILPFPFSKRRNKIDTVFRGLIETRKYETFKLLVNKLKTSNVEEYIAFNYQYAISTSDMAEKTECIQNILEVDRTNVDALREVVFCDLANNEADDKILSGMEFLLKYAPDANAEVVTCLNWLCENLTDKRQCDFAKRLIGCFSGEISLLGDELIRLSYRMIEQGLFEEAEYFLNLVLSFDASNADVYWAICLAKLGAKTDNEIISKDEMLKDIPEFHACFALANETRKNEYHLLSQKQTERITVDIRNLKKEADSLVTKRELARSLMVLFMGLALLIIGIRVGLAYTTGFMLLVLILLSSALFWVGSVLVLSVPSNATINENREKKRILKAKIMELEKKI